MGVHGLPFIAATAAMAFAAASKPRQAQGTQTPVATPQEIARGDSIYHGQLAGGTCFSCHQPNAKGLPGLAPDLTDDKWLHGDGSFPFILATIQTGVPKPKQAVGPMLPRGGTNMTDDQMRAVAAYVHSLRKPKR